MAAIEFYFGSSEKHIAVLDDAAVPREGELINIRKVTYRVFRVTWTVDFAGQDTGRILESECGVDRAMNRPAAAPTAIKP